MYTASSPRRHRGRSASRTQHIVAARGAWAEWSREYSFATFGPISSAQDLLDWVIALLLAPLLLSYGQVDLCSSRPRGRHCCISRRLDPELPAARGKAHIVVDNSIPSNLERALF